MSWGINDSHVKLGGLKLPEGDINGDSSLTLSLKFVQNPGVLEGSFTHVGGLLLKLLNGSLVNSSTLAGVKTTSCEHTLKIMCPVVVDFPEST
jgi:hypothetical protein